MLSNVLSNEAKLTSHSPRRWPNTQFGIFVPAAAWDIQQHSKDVMSAHARRANDITIQPLDAIVKSRGRWEELVVEDRNAGPAEVAITRIDFAAFLNSLQPAMRRIAKSLATGETTKNVARKFGVSQARVSQMRRELQQAWQLFQGELAVA